MQTRRRAIRWTRAIILIVAGYCASCLPHGLSAAEAEEDYDDLKRAVVVSAPRPEYPHEARRQLISGAGVAIMEVDPATGNVTSVRMDPSTGHSLLDNATIDAFRRWRFKPGTVTRVRTPIRYTFGSPPTYKMTVKAEPVDEVLAGYLGKGTVLRGSFPKYPRSDTWVRKSGSGVYELHVQPDGTIRDVKILKTSGDKMFDHITVQTLRKWRLRRGPLIIELPLSFTMTPKSYAVEIPKRR